MKAFPKTRRTGRGPGFVGEPPQRPHGKGATAAAGEFGEDAEEAEAAVRARHHEHRDETSEPREADDHSHVAPFRELEVGDGRQSRRRRRALRLRAYRSGERGRGEEEGIVCLRPGRQPMQPGRIC